MPNKPKTPHRTIRVDDELWDAARIAAAQMHGQTLSVYIRRQLEALVRSHKRRKA